MTETGDAAGKEYKPEYAALRDTQIAYEIAAATERQKRDAMIACWRDVLHSYLKLTYSNPQMIHKVIDSMDNVLNHAGGRRK